MKVFIKRSLFILTIFLLVLVGIPTKANADILNANDKYGKMTLKLNENRHYFIDLQNILPGEHYLKKMVIKNDYNYPYNVYFKISSRKNLSGKSLELLKYINIKIIYGDKSVYNGPANGNDMKDIVLLGTAYPNTEKNLDVYIDISKELDDSFANLETFNRFDFYSNAIYPDNYGENSSNMNNRMRLTNNDFLDNILNPKTGDSFKFCFYLIIILICILSLILLNKKKKIKKDV